MANDDMTRRSTDPDQYDWHSEHKAVSRQQKLIIGLLLFCITTGAGAVVWANSMFIHQQKEMTAAMDEHNTRLSIVEYEIDRGGRYTERRGEALEGRVDRVEASMNLLNTKMERMDANVSFLVNHVRKHDGM